MTIGDGWSIIGPLFVFLITAVYKASKGSEVGSFFTVALSVVCVVVLTVFIAGEPFNTEVKENYNVVVCKDQIGNTMVSLPGGKTMVSKLASFYIADPQNIGVVTVYGKNLFGWTGEVSSDIVIRPQPVEKKQ